MIAPFDLASRVDRLGWVLVHSLWQFALLMLVGFVLQRALQRCTAVTRYWALLATMCATVIAPVATWGLLFTSSPAAADSGAPGQTAMVTIELPAYRAEQDAGVVPPHLDSPHPELESLVLRDEPPNSTPTAHKAWLRDGWVKMQDSLRPWLSVIVCAWCVGVLAFAIRPLLGWHTVRRFRTVGIAPVPESVHSALETVSQRLALRRATQILQSTLVQVPVVAGYFRPVILVPMSVISGLPASQLEAILAHELAHIRRHDYLVNLLQTLLETVFFYHPGVWWLSRQIRNERENCCDDLAVGVVGSGVDYGRALLAVAELHRPSTALVLGVRGGSLLARVRRILGREPSQHVLGGGMLVGVGLIVAALLVVLSALAPAGDAPSPATSALVASLESQDPGEPPWGQVSNGLRIRVVAVAPETDEQKPDWAAATRQATVTRAEDLTLLVELQNASDEPLSLQGTRYGDEFAPPTPGKSASDHFAPLLFECEFSDSQGRPLAGPSHRMLDTDAMGAVSGGLVETLKPAESLVVLLRPVRWDRSLAESLVAGEYQVRLRYHGPAEGVLQKLRKTWPEKPLGRVWTGDVSSAEASFQIADGPEGKRPELVWGEPVKGLRAAVEFRSRDNTAQARLDDRRGEFPHGSRLSVYLHVRNVNEQAISFWSETWRQDDAVMLVDGNGRETRLEHPWYSGEPIIERWTLEPGQTAVFRGIAFGIAADDEAAKKLDKPIGSVIIGKPGNYRVRYELRFNAWQTKDNDGRVIPGDGDWQGTLSTGITTIGVRERRPEDEPPTFTARLRFHGPDGKPVEAGHVQVQVQSRGRPLLETELATGPVDVPNCPFEVLTVYVQAPGFEETRFFDVAVKPDQVTTLTLPRAEPVRFRLVTRDDKPVVGAKVRYFNRSKVEASAGPYPTAGLNGPVWATSNADGGVVLDMLQKVDPLDRKLGNNIYWFYVEPPGLAPLFLGPVQAGAALGDIVVGPLLEVRGEVRGTPGELAAFSAEWDQPEPMKRGNGEMGWYYAESTPVETKRAGDRLTFHLTGLRPGKLRVVSRFQRGGKPISHVYSRREPNEDDVLFEVDLSESRGDLVITNRRQPAKAFWGPASPTGISLGIALEPAKAVYQIGDVVHVKLYLQNSGQREQSLAVPRRGILEKLGMDIDLRDLQGQRLRWNRGGSYSEGVRGLVSGASIVRIAPGESWELTDAALLLGGSGPAIDVVAKLDVKPGQTCRLMLMLATYPPSLIEPTIKAGPLASDTIEFQVEAAGADRSSPAPADKSPDSEVRRQQQDSDLEARREAAQAASKEQERYTETRREALRAEIEQALKQGNQAAAGRHWAALISLPDPPLRDCRQAIQYFEQRRDWSSLATAYEVTAKVMQAIIAAPPERFTRPAPPRPPGEMERGPTVEVQIDLDGVWHEAKGPAEGWFDWIKRKQQEMKGERFKVLCQLAAVYRDRLNEPEKAATTLRESLADMPFYTMPLEKLIADQWPAKKSDAVLGAELGRRRPAATDLVKLLEQRGQFDTAIDIQSRVVLASYWPGGLPFQDIEKLWALLKERPGNSPLPTVAWINLLSPDRPSIEFDLDSFSAPRPEYKLNQLSIAPRPGLEFDSLELTADMEGQGGYVEVWCSTLRDGKQAELGSVKWHQDRRKGRESRTAKFSVPAGTGVIYFNRAWLPDTDPDAITLHRISVRATFRSVPSGSAVGHGAEIPVVPATHRVESNRAETTRASEESATVTPQAANLAIEATILGLDGQPVAKSMVTFWREVPTGEATEDSDWRDPRTNKTWRAVHGSATGGTTQQSGLSPGTYLVTARDGHEYHAPFGASEPIQLDGSVRQQSVKVRLQPGGTLRVVVTDVGNDQVLTRASVILTSTDTFLPPQTMIHSVRDGDTFVYDHLPPGNYRVAASKRANAPDQLEYALAGDARPVTVALGETRQIRIAVQGRPLTETEIGRRWPWIVRGRVTDKDGKPVEGATIRASAGWGSLSSEIIATTDKEGHYSGRFAQSGSVAMLAEDDPLNLVSAQVGARKDGLAEANLNRQGGMHAAYRVPRPGEQIPEYVDTKRLFIRGKPREVNFVLVPGATIRARVLDSAQQPVASTGLSLGGPELPPASSAIASDKTDADGTLTFTEIPVGYSWWFELSVERLKSVRSVPMHFEAARYEMVLQHQVEPATGVNRLVLLSAHDAGGKDVSQAIVAGKPK